MNLIIGGSANGKSAYAEELLCSMQKENRIYLATMQVLSASGEARVNRHLALRAGKGFETAEKPVDLNLLRLPEDAAVLLEDLPNLCANEYFREDRKKKSAGELAGEVLALSDRVKQLVIVSGNIFADGILYPEETDAYLAYLADVQNRLADHAKRVTEVVYGIPIELKRGEKQFSDCICHVL